VHTIERRTHQGNDRFRSVVDIARGEAKQANASVDQAILATVVLCQRATMRNAVVFNA
jgi:hypothetical protein